jgi:2-polyprenyl-3-methyl-5-hydroxy-6-metoxy-1,4-benzoquinol methylase
LQEIDADAVVRLSASSRRVSLGGSIGSVTIRIDLEGSETDALFDLVELEGRGVLEIGCGDGRLTWRYADRADHVTAIDPFEDAIGRAKQRLRGTDLPIDFRHVAFEDFAAASDTDVFDVALLSWSLC